MSYRQYLLRLKGLSHDIDLKILKEIYRKVRELR
jgi:hypothetical protein